MFYSNAMGNAAKGARKKAHGGSGISGNGDAYGPQSKNYTVLARKLKLIWKHSLYEGGTRAESGAREFAENDAIISRSGQRVGTAKLCKLNKTRGFLY